jgi:hypothetical protein
VSVATVRLQSDIGALIVGDKSTHERVRQEIEKLTSVRPVSLKSMTGYIEIVVGYDAIVTINEQGVLNVRSERLSYGATDRLKESIAAALGKLGIRLTTDKIASSIKTRYGKSAVVDDRLVGTNKNIRTLKVRI